MLLPAELEGGPVFVICRSACGVTVVDCEALSLAGVWSVALVGVTVPLAVTGPLPGAVTMMLKAAFAPETRLNAPQLAVVAVAVQAGALEIVPFVIAPA